MGNWWDSYSAAPNQAPPAAPQPRPSTGGFLSGPVSPVPSQIQSSDAQPGLWSAAAALPQTATPQASDSSSISPLLDRLHQMRQIGDEAGSDILSKATGPDYGRYSRFLPDTSSPAYQNIRSWAQHLNPFSDVDSSDRGQPLPYDEAPKLNAKFQQLQAVIGNGPNDPNRAFVTQAIGQALHAPNPETFFAVLHEAENGLRTKAGYAPLPKPTSYLPASWSRSNPAAPIAMIDDAGASYYRGQDGKLVRRFGGP